MQSYAVSKLLLGVSMSALLMACHASRPLVGGPTVAIQPLPAHEARQLQQARRNILGLDAKDKDVRILAFGDSITEGWVNTAWVKTPWTPIVQQKLQQRLAGWNVELVNGGIGSAGVLDLLNEAFKRQLQDAKSAGKPFHYIIFEAGINDILMQHRNTPEIFDRMKELWSLANADGSTVVVIPPLPTDAQGEREEERETLVGKMKSYIEQQRSAGNKGLFLLDLEKYYDYYALSPRRRRQIFDDGVHLTETGYKMLADLVYDGLIKAMEL